MHRFFLVPSHEMKLRLIIWLIFAPVLLANAQTYSGLGGEIPDDGTTGTYSLQVTGLSPAFLDTTYGLESVMVNIFHPYVEELRMELISPDGNIILLTEHLGYNGQNFLNTVFSDQAETSIYNGSAPYTGAFRPLENVGYVNNGQDGNGLWQLRILDESPGVNSGTLTQWAITFGAAPGKPFPFDSSNLPLVLIDTYGQRIPDDPKIPVGMKIIDNGEGRYNHLSDMPVYDYYAGIELRGSSSQSFLKKSYGLETWDIENNSIDTSLLGMPVESDWILNASFSDKTLLRNAMAYQTWMNMDHYATRYRFVEVFLNNRYKGVYLFSEKIKRDKNRLNIAKLTEEMNSGDQLTGGYILKIDKWTGSGGDGWVSDYPPPVNTGGQYIFFQYEYPKQEDITDQQKEYIRDYVNLFESALAGPWFADTSIGFRKYAEPESFRDYFIVNEFSKNVDAYRISTFFHKQRESLGGKLRMGPVWDYDLAWHNADYYGNESPAGWEYQFAEEWDDLQVPFWWQRMLEDTLFNNCLKCRWTELRAGFLSNDAVFNWIDSTAQTLDAAQERNFICWPILGVYVWPNPSPLPETYAGEISSLKEWTAERLSWLDNNMPGNCWSLGTGEPAPSALFRVYPNPATDFIVAEGPLSGAEESIAELFDLPGKRLKVIHDFSPGKPIDVRWLQPGYYFLRIRTGSSVSTCRFTKTNTP